MKETKDIKRIKHTEGFDILRGIGIVGIVLYHIFPSLFPGGFLGVPLFFVLSGYLMFVTSDSAWRRGTFHVGSYYIRRLRKIFPPLFVMVMAVCSYLTLFSQNSLIGISSEIRSIFLGYDNWWQIGQNASYFSKMANASPFTHLWFLAVEIQFYILWPFVFILYKKGCQVFGAKTMCLLFMILSAASAARMFLLYTPDTDPSRVYYGTDTMAFPILIGISSGALTRQNHKNSLFPKEPFLSNSRSLPFDKKCKMVILLCCFMLSILLLFITVNGQNSFVYRGGMFFISLYFAAIIYVMEKQRNFFENTPKHLFLSLVGKNSYIIYLWHYPVIILSMIPV